MAIIKKLLARQVFDSRGNPTTECEIHLDGGGLGRFITPSGASCGSKEALELRDGDSSVYCGRSVYKAIDHIIENICQAIINRDFSTQQSLDRVLLELDGTENKSRLGANALLAVSGAFFHAFANKNGVPLYRSFTSDEQFCLPMPMINVINGGVHANNDVDVQEFMIVPTGASSFSEAMALAAETFYALKSIIASKKLPTAVGDEGGFAPSLSSNEAGLDLLLLAIEKAGLRPGHDVSIALDVAASELYDQKGDKYRLQKRELSRAEMVLWYAGLCEKYPIVSIEDPFHEDDSEGFASLCKAIGERVQIVGDDLFVTNEKYIRMGIEKRLANAVLIKMNQIGTITETISAIALTKSAGWNAIVSHRSGDSEDTTIADLAVLCRTGQIKTGSLCRSERTAKYNQLLRIEEELGADARLFQPFKR